MDKREFRKRVWLRMLSSPLTLLPAVGGASLLLVGWALGLRTGLLIFSGLLGVLTGLGTFLSRLFLGGGRVAEEEAQRIDREARSRREAALDDLEGRLATDGDPRTEAALHDLRVLADSVKSQDDWGTLNARSAFDLVSGVDELFSTSVRYLERTLALKKTADRVTSPNVRHAILEEREQLVADVEKSTTHIGELLSKMQRMAVSGGSHSDLERLREELDANLDVARKVEERMAAWDDSRVKAG